MPLPPTWATGEHIQLTNHQKTLLLVIEKRRNCASSDRNATCVTFARPNAPYRRLRVSKSEQNVVDWSGTGDGKDSAWIVDNPTSCTTSLRSCMKPKGKGNKKGVDTNEKGNNVMLLMMGHNGLEVMSVDRRNKHADQFQWHATAVECALAPISQPPPLCLSAEYNPVQELSSIQLQTFVKDGVLHIPKCVPDDILKQAQTSIHSRLGRPGGLVFDEANGAEQPQITTRRPPSGHRDISLPLDPNGACSGRFSQEASFDPSLLLPATCPPVARLIAQLIGHGKVAPITSVQIALRFPGCNDSLVCSGAAMKRSEPTGTDWHTDGLRQGKKHSFTMLVGIALSDTLLPNHGNLCVWPNSHNKIHQWQRHPDGKIRRANGGYSDLDGPLPDLGISTQMLVKAGDVVFVHSEVGHCGSGHVGHEIRSMLYYRVRHKRWVKFVEEGSMVDDMWCDFSNDVRDVAYSETH